MIRLIGRPFAGIDIRKIVDRILGPIGSRSLIAPPIDVSAETPAEHSRDRATKIIAEINRCRHEIKALYRELSEVMPDEDLHGLPARSQIARELNMSRDLVIGMESSGVWHHYGWGFDDTDCGLSVENMVVVSRDGRRVCKSCLKAT